MCLKRSRNVVGESDGVEESIAGARSLLLGNAVEASLVFHCSVFEGKVSSWGEVRKMWRLVEGAG